jgi:hypothetical protein
MSALNSAVQDLRTKIRDYPSGTTYDFVQMLRDSIAEIAAALPGVDPQDAEPLSGNILYTSPEIAPLMVSQGTPNPRLPITKVITMPDEASTMIVLDVFSNLYAAVYYAENDSDKTFSFAYAGVHSADLILGA